MKKFKYFLSFLLLMLLIFISVSEVFAMNTGFSVTNSFSDDEKKHIIKVSNIKLLREEPEKEPIQCFDINKDGLIALGTKNTSDIYYICIYNSDGIFQYGYSFANSGSFGIEFDNENIIIYFVRSDIVISVNPSGEILEIAKVDNTMENNSYRHVLRNTERQINDTKYKIKNDMGIFNLFVGQSSYSQLVKIDGLQNQTILYDVNSKLFAKTLMILIFALLLFATVVIVLTKLIIKNIRKINTGNINTGND